MEIISTENAVKIVLKHIKDYEGQYLAVMDSAMMRKDLCKHPYSVQYTVGEGKIIIHAGNPEEK